MYKVRLKKPAEKYLNKLSGKMYLAVRYKIEELKTNPVPGDAIPLKGYSQTYRIRLGSLRIIYEIHKGELIILIIDIGPRGQVYDNY
ncbi:MAG: type II toxin-antitoxin system RelE/ParE family toxin [Chitinophagaceae bacterium]|nr:type II toxin-antitoxin system RelE/ParE family toxin [Chitinophagaceae bacterium]